MLVSLNWLKEFVNVDLAANDLAQRLTMAGFEVESVQKLASDTIFDVGITPNRGDCLSIIGVAREVAAITGKEFKIPPNPPLLKRGRGGLKTAIKMNEYLSVEVKDNTKCIRYAARLISNVKLGPSPKWMAERLESCGIRSINNVVDATNYLMLETGQPFHAFDYRFIRGKKIVVKTIKVGIDFVILDGLTRKIIGDDLLICDGEGPVAIAGVMGGANSEIKNDTTTVVLESACFLPTSVRKTSKRLALASESSRRFERVVDPNMTVANMNRLAELIIQIAGGEATVDYIDIYPKKIKPLKVKYNHKETNNLIGQDVSIANVKHYFKSLGFGFSGTSCTIPTFRPDIKRSVDLIEEVARLNGYDKIPVTRPLIEMSEISRPRDKKITDRAKDFIVSHGYYEAINYGFASPTEAEPFAENGFISISNPLGVEFSAMKTSLLPGLLNNLKYNLNQGNDNVKIFESRPVFLPIGNTKREEKRLTGINYGPRTTLSWTSKQEDADFFDIKGLLTTLAKHVDVTGIEFRENKKYLYMNPTASAEIYVGSEFAGVCGLIHPFIATKWDIKGSICAFELNWNIWSDQSGKERKLYKQLEKYPVVRRDIAVLIDRSIKSEKVLESLFNLKSAIIREVLPFDVYKGKGIPEGKKSVAYAIMYANPEKTLTDDEINAEHNRVVSCLKENLGAEIR